MGKRVDLSEKTLKKTKITRRLTTYTSHSFYNTNLINGVTTKSEETNEEQELEQNELTEENQNENNNEELTKNIEEDNNNEENTNSNEQANVNDNVNKAKNIKNTLEKLKNGEKKAKKAKTIAAILKNPLTIKILVVIMLVALGIIGLIILISIMTNIIPGSSTLAFGDVYNMRCSEMTVIYVDSNNGYAPTGTETFSMTDYVAGVVAAEIGGFANKEVYKVYALAARTFGLTAASDDCTIEASARKQAFKDVTNSSGGTVDMIYEAVRETEGQVLLSNGELYRLQYDAFCYVDKDENYYTLSQKKQKIPVEWANKYKSIWNKHYFDCPCNLNDKSMTECWDEKGRWQDGGHGRGMSQYGAYYLATEQGYTYDQILEYYYGDAGVTISSNSVGNGIEGITSIAGLEIKNTTKATELKQPISEFLSSKGSSLEDMNNYIHSSVVDQGAGTRAGVVTAAVSMINYLYDNFNTKLPYYWGGKIYSGSKIPATFGKYIPSTPTANGFRNYYVSFDCSGFVSWSIRAGGYNFEPHSTGGFASSFYKNSCDITENNCIGQPGDLINYRNYSNTAGHVLLILAVDEENGKYFVAHSGGKGVVMEERNMHAKEVNDGITKIVFMEEYYTNPSNINNSY